MHGVTMKVTNRCSLSQPLRFCTQNTNRSNIQFKYFFLKLQNASLRDILLSHLQYKVFDKITMTLRDNNWHAFYESRSLITMFRRARLCLRSFMQSARFSNFYLFLIAHNTL